MSDIYKNECQSIFKLRHMYLVMSVLMSVINVKGQTVRSVM